MDLHFRHMIGLIRDQGLEIMCAGLHRAEADEMTDLGQ